MWNYQHNIHLYRVEHKLIDNQIGNLVNKKYKKTLLKLYLNTDNNTNINIIKKYFERI